MCEAIQSSVLTNSRHETIEAWSERDRRLLAQLCVPKPRSWSHIIVAFQQNAEHFRSAEAITKQWDLVESSEPNLVQEVQDCMVRELVYFLLMKYNFPGPSRKPASNSNRENANSNIKCYRDRGIG